MYSFLAQPNAIAHLDLSNTECSLDVVMFLYCSGGGLRTAIEMGFKGFLPNKIFS